MTTMLTIIAAATMSGRCLQ